MSHNPRYILSEPEPETQSAGALDVAQHDTALPETQAGRIMNPMPAECERCTTTLASLRAETPSRTLHYFMAMWFCPSCYLEEKTLQEQSAAEAEARVIASREASRTGNGVRQAEPIVELQEEIFNASTLAIMELKKIIDADSEIPQEKKAFELGLQLQARFKEFQQVMFDARETLTQAGNASRAIQQYMNTLANQLRVEEREKLKLVDVQYNPSRPKTVKPKSPSGRAKLPKKFDKEACREAAAKYGVPMEMVQTLVTVKQISYDEAAQLVATKLAQLA